MNWISFMIATPVYGKDIIILNYFRSEPQGNVEKRYFICKSEKYLQVLGENSLNTSHTFWLTIDTKIIDVNILN